jgi:S-DNA-T family DNA segregation ATPase FtsK/SpoIIIE
MVERILLYSSICCREIQLPTVSEGKYSCLLEKELFHLNEDLSLRFVTMGNRWTFAPAAEYRIIRNGQDYSERQLTEGDVLTLVAPQQSGQIRMVAAGGRTCIPVMKKFELHREEGDILFGSDPGCNICVRGSSLVPGMAAKLFYQADSSSIKGKWMISPVSDGSLYVNGLFLAEPRALSFGDSINLYGTHFVFLGDLIAAEIQENVTVYLKEADTETIRWVAAASVSLLGRGDAVQEEPFSPSPRQIVKPENRQFEIDPPPEKQEMKKASLLASIGPSFAMVIPMILSAVFFGGSPATFLIMAGSASIMALFTVTNRRKQEKEAVKQEKLRNEKYRKYLQEKDDEIFQTYTRDRNDLLAAYPDLQTCLGYDRNSNGLWSRMPQQEDYDFIRLGRGNVPFQHEIKIPEKHFTLKDDELRDEPLTIAGKYALLKDVPVGIRLRDFQGTGIIGGRDRQGCIDVLIALIGQIAANFSPADVKMVLLCDEKGNRDRRLLEIVKWLPHFWSDGGDFRYVGDEEESRKEVLNEIRPVLKKRWDEEKSSMNHREDRKNRAFYVIFSTAPDLMDGDMVLTYFSDSSVHTDAALFLCSENLSGLPAFCSQIIENDDSFQGVYCTSDNKTVPICFDHADQDSLEQLAHRLISIRVRTPEEQQDIPRSITFLEMYKARTAEDLHILQRWRENRIYNSMSVPIGMEAGGLLCCLDIHQQAHGPHGLVAGTTGSGKSETLMTYILSLAANFSPEDISFLLVDFKGGGLTNEFDNPSHRLPHLAGTITNLGGSQISRALVSINSELKRREKLFTDAGVKGDIYEYAKLYKNHEVTEPLPHLIIIIDEFAQLKKEFPDFMKSLTSVATVGRSLGVHLILATQKPAGVVDATIDANSRFRICLKVASEQDSKDMLKHPDAAHIPGNGRGFLRVGEDEIYQMFQSAWSGADYLEEKGEGAKSDIATLYTITGKAQISGTHQKRLRKEKQELAWTSSLLEAVKEVEGDLCGKTGSAQDPGRRNHLEQFLNEESLLTELRERFYQSFSERKWNIVPNPANDQKIVDLVIVYEDCRKEKSGQDVTAEELQKRLSKSTGRSFPEITVRKQLDAVVDEICRVCSENDISPVRPLWLPELPTRLPLSELPESMPGYDEERTKDGGWFLDAPIGLVDDPKDQYQGTAVMDFAGVGNYIVCGGVLSGKSTLLQTVITSLVMRYTPYDISLYLLDFSARGMENFREAPQVGGVLTEQDLDSVNNFFFFIRQILAERKKKIAGGTFAQYQMSGQERMPAVLIVIDQYGAFREKTSQMYDAEILRLSKEGTGYGIYLLLTGGGISSSEIPMKLAETIRGRVALQLMDKYAYREILGGAKTETIPQENIRGRGMVLFRGEPLEFQAAVADGSKDDFERSEHIRRLCLRLKENWTGRPARKIPMIPDNPVLSGFFAQPEVIDLLKDDRHVPVGYAKVSAAPYSIDLSHIYLYVVSGREKAGRANFMNLMLKAAARKGGRITVFGTGTGVFRKIALEEGAAYIMPEDNLVPFALGIRDEITERNRRKVALENEGKTEEEIFQAMNEYPVLWFFIEDLVGFTQKLYNPSAGQQDVHKFFETIAQKGWYHHMYFIAGISQEDAAGIRGTAFYQAFAHDRNGIHFGGNASGQTLLTFDYLGGFKEQAQMLPPQEGLVATGDGAQRAGRIIVPDALK